MNKKKALKRIIELDDSYHEAGILTLQALEYLIDWGESNRIENSLETGCGVSTLALSWLSDKHRVFTLSHYGETPAASYFNVLNSDLLNDASTRFVLGPTQLTLPEQISNEALDLALIDGPHAFPFPQIEYYYLYPNLKPGALLVIDDIHIPTVRWLHDFVIEDDMFALDRVVCNTGFYIRTESETFNPTGDDWWLQAYNKKRFSSEPSLARRMAARVFRRGR